MTRRSGMPADSLELLLDTICNTFGGIIFIALLVVVLLMISGERQTLHSSPEDAAKAIAEQNQLEDLTRLKERLESSLEKQTKTVSMLTRDDLAETLATYQLELDRNSELETEIPALQQQIQQHEAGEQDLTRKIKELQLRLPEMEAQLTALRNSLTEHRSSRRKTLRMPVARSPGIKREVLLVLQFRRLYCWHQYSPSGTREGLNTRDFLILSESEAGVVTSPNPAAGIPVDTTKESAARIARSMKSFDPSMDYLAVVVRPDSYGAFQYLRDAIAESGFEYRLIPAESDGGYVDRGGSGGLIQ
ncbi:PspA/IM30 family protein [Planctomicrobium sp. SH661]|uniref:PspA/IM30 family protein n=1 Tax=Planctomicrobium sp. SH661 TaxID=3448124 RepID=UPI003F5BB0DC